MLRLPGEATNDRVPGAYPKYKADLRRTFLRYANARRIHIIGAARSGTTMVHYAMHAFENTVVHDGETSVEFSPSLRETMALLARSFSKRMPLFFVTKRSINWYLAENVTTLLRYAVTDNIAVLHVIRDPRDVLTSSHADDEREYYLEPERWAASIDAAEDLLRRLPGHCTRHTLRYEDIVLRPETVEGELWRTFGLRLRPGVNSWANLAQTLELAGVSPRMVAAMHGVRDFDEASIGRWKRRRTTIAYVESLMSNPELGARLQRFLASNNYLP